MRSTRVMICEVKDEKKNEKKEEMWNEGKEEENRRTRGVNIKGREREKRE